MTTSPDDAPRVHLAQLPTPLERLDRLTDAWAGPTIWCKRDDLTGFGLSGNKIRKLERHLGAAIAAGRTGVVTCGAAQSNHCRATALAAARLGLQCILVLRTRDAEPPDTARGNHLLQRLAGADCRFVTPREYAERRFEIMGALADAHGNAAVIPEGASDELGMLGFADAFDEFAVQWRAAGVDGAPVVWHASSSGGTSAGLALGAHRTALDCRLIGASVGEPTDALWARIHGIVDTSAHIDRRMLEALTLDDRHIGLGYGKTTPAELEIQRQATRLTGLLWDPTYTGKAISGLKAQIESGDFTADDHVVFWHTGGGFAVFAHDVLDG